MVRQYLGNVLMGWGRKLGRQSGAELAVELSQHSISIGMEAPDEDNRAWDSSLYRKGNVFIEDYANPIKPTVQHHKKLEDPDTADVEEGETDVGDSEEGDEEHVELISSPRYRDYMRQDLISQLLNPREQWRLLAYGIIALGILQFLGIIVTMYATGAF